MKTHCINRLNHTWNSTAWAIVCGCFHSYIQRMIEDINKDGKDTDETSNVIYEEDETSNVVYEIVFRNVRIWLSQTISNVLCNMVYTII